MKPSMFMKGLTIALYVAGALVVATAWAPAHTPHPQGSTVHVVNAMKAGSSEILTLSCILGFGEKIGLQHLTPGEEFSWKYSRDVQLYLCNLYWNWKRISINSFVDLGDDIRYVDQVYYKATEDGLYLKSTLKDSWTLKHTWPVKH